MTENSAILLQIAAIIIGIIAVYGVLLYRDFRRKKKAEPFNVHKTVSQALAELNCKMTWGKDKDDEIVKFDYQSGHFSLRIEKGDLFVRLTYPFFFSTSVENIELIREMCNRCNISSTAVRMIYSVNEKSYVVDLHMTAYLPAYDALFKPTLEQTMTEIFNYHGAFVNGFKSVISHQKGQDRPDLEKDNATRDREVSLLHEQELLRQPAGSEWREPDNYMSLSHVVSRMLKIKDMEPHKLTCHRDDETPITLTDADAINNLSLSSLIISKHPDDGKPAFMHESAVLNLQFTDKTWPDRERKIVMFVNKESVTSHALYYRITLTLIPLSTDRSIHLDYPENKVVTLSFLAAFDLMPNSHWQNKFKYLWKEALSKDSKGESDSMTNDEKLLAACIEPDTGENLYKGKCLYLDGRVYEALPYLLRAFEWLRVSMSGTDTKQRFAFFEDCYLIGSCYCALHLYTEAYYYLEFTLPLKHILYTEQYVNCLVNAGDIRAVSIIEELLSEVMGNMKMSDLPEPHQQFANFLMRRKAAAFVNMRKYDEAEKMLKKMLDEPENVDYAIDELAYLQKLKD